MADNNQIYRIVIVTEANDDGFQKTSAAAQKLTADTKALAAEMGVINVSEEDVAKATESMGEKVENAGKKVEKGGKKAGESAEGHQILSRIMGELNRISPGLGEVLELLAAAHRGAGAAAEGEAAANVTLAASFETVIASMGPMVIAMLAIEAAMQLWDSYKEKAKAAADAQAEASKRIVESVHKAREAVEELEKAMHPEKKNLAGQDEENLKKQQQDLDNAYDRQKELNQANEQKELKGAGSDAEKEAIKQRFEALNAELDDWRNKQKAAIEGTMTGTMEGQLKQLEKEKDELVKKSGPLYRMSQERGTDADKNAYDAIARQIQAKADEAKAIREKLDELKGQQTTDASNAAFKSETNREVFGAKGIKYQTPGQGMPQPDQGQDFAENKFATGKSIADLATHGGQASEAQQQFLVLLEQSITGHKLTFEQAVRAMEEQTKNTEFASKLIQNAHGRIDAVSAKLQQLEQQNRHGATQQ